MNVSPRCWHTLHNMPRTRGKFVFPVDNCQVWRFRKCRPVTSFFFLNLTFGLVHIRSVCDWFHFYIQRKEVRHFHRCTCLRYRTFFWEITLRKCLVMIIKYKMVLVICTRFGFSFVKTNFAYKLTCKKTACLSVSVCVCVRVCALPETVILKIFWI